MFYLLDTGNSFIRALAAIIFLLAVCWFAAYVARAAEVQIPQEVTAGKSISIATSGSGEETFYLMGPATTSKGNVKLGESIQIAPEDIRAAGRYVIIVGKGDDAVRKTFYVKPAQPASVNFLARPSRVPAAKQGVISGVAFVYDAFNNTVLAPTPVEFNLAVEGAAPVTRTLKTQNGIAWARMDSGRKAGAAQFVASVGETSVRRVVQQVAADACDLRLKARRAENAIVVETDPVRDCAGNPVPDGTIVTFTEVDANGRSTVDARVKRGIAKAELPLSDRATVSVAAGIVMGNEIQIGGGQ